MEQNQQSPLSNPIPQSTSPTIIPQANTPPGPQIIVAEKKKSTYLIRIFSGRLNRQNFYVGSILSLIVPLIFLVVLIVNGLSIPDAQLATLDPYQLSYTQPTADSLSKLFVTPTNTTIAILFFVSLFISSFFLIAFQIRRLHDLNQSGWLSLIGLLPVISYALGLYISLWSGTDGENKYGPKPLARTNLSEDILCLR